AVLAYTIDVNNAGPIAAPNVTVVDTLPAGTAFTSAVGMGWSCNHAAGVVTCTRAAPLAIGAAPAITIVVTPTADDGTTITNTATVSSTAADPDPSDNTAAIDTLVIDREIAVTATSQFPDAFRNPGDLAPVRPITVTNTGMATLHVTSVTVATTDPAVWTLVDPGPQAIPPGGSFDYLLRFSPTAIGPAPEATVTIASDDRDEPTSTVVFTGMGIDRNVAFGDPTIDLGFTGV